MFTANGEAVNPADIAIITDGRQEFAPTTVNIRDKRDNIRSSWGGDKSENAVPYRYQSFTAGLRKILEHRRKLKNLIRYVTYVVGNGRFNARTSAA